MFLEWREFVLLRDISVYSPGVGNIFLRSGDIINADKAEFRNKTWHLVIESIGKCTFPLGFILPWFCEYHYENKDKMRAAFLIDTHVQEIISQANDPYAVDRQELLYLSILRLADIVRALSSLLFQELTNREIQER